MINKDRNKDKYSVLDLQRRLTHEGRDWAIYHAPIQAVEAVGLYREYKRFSKMQTQGINLENELRDALRVCAMQVAYDNKKEDRFWYEMRSILNLKEGSDVKKLYSWLNTKKALEHEIYRRTHT
jgi:hypothetical protein